jgi:anti-sigma B factor antagonist
MQDDGSDQPQTYDPVQRGVPFAVQRGTLDDRIGLIALCGEVDISTSPRFKEALQALIDDGLTDVVVDLTEVTFIDSTALGVLVGAVRKLHPLQGRLVVVAEGHAVMRPVTLTGLDRVFTVVPSREEAVAAF